VRTSELVLRPLSPAAGAEILGVDLRGEISEGTREQLRDAWRRYALLLFRDQELTKMEQRRVAQIFGTVTDESFARLSPRAKDGFDYVSNIVEGGINPSGELGFHTENSMFERPLRGLMLYALEMPPEGEGGDTLFSNLKLAYQSLPPALRRQIANLRVRHGYPDGTKGRAVPGLLADDDAPHSIHPLTYAHPDSGEPLLFLSRRHVDCIVDLPRDQSLALIEELASYIGRPEHTYRHTWKARDLVVWDNFTLQHARTNFDPKHRRHLRRLQLK
jgi:taurine dioxygenase